MSGFIFWSVSRTTTWVCSKPCTRKGSSGRTRRKNILSSASGQRHGIRKVVKLKRAVLFIDPAAIAGSVSMTCTLFLCAYTLRCQQVPPWFPDGGNRGSHQRSADRYVYEISETFKFLHASGRFDFLTFLNNYSAQG